MPTQTNSRGSLPCGYYPKERLWDQSMPMGPLIGDCCGLPPAYCNYVYNIRLERKGRVAFDRVLVPYEVHFHGDPIQLIENCIAPDRLQEVIEVL